MCISNIYHYIVDRYIINRLKMNEKKINTIADSENKETNGTGFVDKRVILGHSRGDRRGGRSYFANNDQSSLN